MATVTPAVLDVSSLTCAIAYRKKRIEIVKDMDLVLRGGETVSIMGRSGAGKTTILRAIAGLHTPVGGRVEVAGHPMAGSESERARVRLRHIGFVYQDFRLINQLDALDNVALAARLQGRPRDEAMDLARAMLDRVGLGGRAHHRPAQLSGGECQRVGIARALMGNPTLILADEPTGSLDEESRDDILDLLRGATEGGAGLLIVTHDPGIAARCQRTYRLREGSLAISE